MSDYAKKFATNLKVHRKKLNLTQKDFANLMGYSEKAISKWECGASVPGIETLFNISKILKTSLDSLFCDEKIYFLGIDGGGTKTNLILADESGKVLRTLKADACNPMDIGIETTKSLLKEAIYEICANLPFSCIYTFAGIAGGTSGDMQHRLNQFFEEFGFADFKNNSDNLNIISAGLDEKDGITVVVGTGICVYIQKSKTLKRLAGWGYLIDNGGSGYNIGRDGLSAYFSSIDNTIPPSLISEVINKKFSGGAPVIMDYIYKDGKKAVASFAPLIFEAAKKGDPTAINILNKNAAEVVKLIKSASKEFCQETIPVVFSGGVTKEKLYMDCINKLIKQPDKYKIKILDCEPVYGALKLAQQLKKEDE